MMPPSQPPQPMPHKNLYAFLFLGALAIIITITALALGYGRSSNSSREIDALQRKLDETQAKVDQLQKDQDNTPTSTTENGRGFGDPMDERILLTNENIARYCSFEAPTYEQCVANQNNDKPSTTVNYDDTTHGISVQIPFNPNWGNATFRLNPYELKPYDVDALQMDAHLSFGYLSLFEGGSLTRWYGLTFTQPRSANEAMDTVIEFAGQDRPPQKKTVNGVTYIEYSLSDDLCERPAVEVIGRKANYVIAPLCGEAATEFPFLESIVKSIRFIN